jgi:hypothetical protein
MNNLFSYFTKILNTYFISFEKIATLSLLYCFIKKVYVKNSLDDKDLDKNNYLYYTCSICCKKIKSYDLIYKYNDKVFCSHNCRKIIDE